MIEIKELVLPEGTKEVRVIEVQGLSEQKQNQVAIAGNIDSVLRFLEKRYRTLPDGGGEEDNNYPNVVLPLNSNVQINRDAKSIELTFNETDPYAIGKVSGKLVEHSDFTKWKINSGEGWGHQQLAEFCKMNRSLFPDPVTAMKLFKELKDVKIKTDKEYELSKDNRGSERFLVAQKVIASNIPESFTLKVPVFKGQEKQTFEVEVYVDAQSYMVTLISPMANDIVSEFLDRIIDEQKKSIQELCPEIAIIEK